MQGNVHERGLRQSIDWRLVLYYLLLVFFGWINIYASTQSAGPSAPESKSSGSLPPSGSPP